MHVVQFNYTTTELLIAGNVKIINQDLKTIFCEHIMSHEMHISLRIVRQIIGL